MINLQECLFQPTGLFSSVSNILLLSRQIFKSLRKKQLRNGAVDCPGCAARLATTCIAITHTHDIALTCWRAPPGPGLACCIALAGHPENPQSPPISQTWFVAARLTSLNAAIRRIETPAKDANPHTGHFWIEATLEPGDDSSALRPDFNDPQKGNFVVTSSIAVRFKVVF